LQELRGKIDDAVEKFSIGTKEGIQKQKEELETKYKQLEERKNKAKTDHVGISNKN
jgi:hypothetical protein